MFNPNAANRQTLLISVLIFLFSLLSIALIITWNTPATGYEASIYRSTPLILWVSLVASVISGITLVVVSIAKNELDRNYLWKIGFLLVFLSYVVCLSLFIIRGYYMWCMNGDPASHIGWIKETINTGHVPTVVVYPITHIYLSQIIFMTGLDLVILHKIIPVLFSVLFILYMYVFAKAVFHNTSSALLVGIASCASFSTDFYLNLAPNGLSSLLIPLFLFVIFKCMYRGSVACAVPRSMLVILYPVFHPVPAMFIGLVLLTLWIPTTIQRMVQYTHEWRKTLPDLESYKLKFGRPLLTLIIWFLFWISGFRVFALTIGRIFQSVFGEEAPSEAMDLVNKVSYAQGYGISVTEIAIKQYGTVMVLFALSVIAILMLLKNLHQDRYNESILSLSGPFGALLITMPVLFLFKLPFNAFRFLHALIILMLILSTYTLDAILVHERRPFLLRRTIFSVILVVIILSGLFLGGLLKLYPSPYICGTNYHSTHSEVAGMEYIFDHHNLATPLTGISIFPGRFAMAFLTLEERAILRSPTHLEAHVPWHFGYDKNSSLSSAYDKNTDLAIASRDRALYTDIFPYMAEYRFTRQDFQQLEIDPGVDALYSNGGFDFYKVNVMTPFIVKYPIYDHDY